MIKMLMPMIYDLALYLCVTEKCRGMRDRKQIVMRMREIRTHCLGYHDDPSESMKFVEKFENVKLLGSTDNLAYTISVWLAAIM